MMASPKTRLFLITWLAGMAGVLSFLTIDISLIIVAIPTPEGAPPPELPPPALLKLVSIIQPAALVTLAAVVGAFLSSSVGLHAPAAEALANREPFWPALRPQLVPGVITGLLCGIDLVGIWLLAKPFLSPEFLTRAQQFNSSMPNAVRMLYGGFTEEILLRWGLMTFLIWILWRLFQRGKDTPATTYLIAAILVSAILFGVGHLPVASLLAGGLSVPLVIYVLTANSVFGILAGLLYWRRGLEAAMVAHMSVHVVLIIAISLAL